jgi:2-polyprenyl-3-methyl-5-hydroxy-6-metoxy-1,4-benzoquinol methylase
MINFQHRSSEKELLDGVGIPFEDIALNLKELDFINSNLGGHSITINGFKQLTGKKENISVCEIGCGGGDNLKALSSYCNKNKIKASFTGIDINPDCIDYAKRSWNEGTINFIVSDYRLMQFGMVKPDIIFSSLFCHHFSEQELVEMVQWMQRNAGIGFFINDLHRHPVAYYFIRYMTKFFSKSYLVQNDAPLSVLRGFLRNEWKEIFRKAAISKYSIRWKWAFRYLVIVPAFTEKGS